MAKRCKFVDFEAKEVVDVSDSDDDVSEVSASEYSDDSSDSNDLDSNDDPHWYRKHVDRAQQCRLGTIAMMGGYQCTRPPTMAGRKRSGPATSSSPRSRQRLDLEPASSRPLRSSATTNQLSFTQLLQALTGFSESELQVVMDTIDTINSTRRSASQVQSLARQQFLMIPSRIGASRTFNEQVEDIIADATALPKSSHEKPPSPSAT